MPEENAVDSEAEKTILDFDEIEQVALEGLEGFINKKNAYEFQDLVAALLRGMGYYTPFVAPKGKDGGVDVVAYRDPLGTENPRIQVQVKHREFSATVQEVTAETAVERVVGLVAEDRIAARATDHVLDLRPDWDPQIGLRDISDPTERTVPQIDRVVPDARGDG